MFSGTAGTLRQNAPKKTKTKQNTAGKQYWHHLNYKGLCQIIIDNLFLLLACVNIWYVTNHLLFDVYCLFFTVSFHCFYLVCLKQASCK